jgi:cupin 2 domain-containing protein
MATEFIKEAGNLFTWIAPDLDSEIFDVLLNSENVRIERIVSTGQTSPQTGWYDQADNEWVIILKGSAVLSFENSEINLHSGDYFNIPAHTKHKVSWTDPDAQTVWLAIHY